MTACESSNGASSGSDEVPCPPADKSSTLWWEDNSFHRLSHAKWAQAFEAQAASLQVRSTALVPQPSFPQLTPFAFHTCSLSGGRTRS